MEGDQQEEFDTVPVYTEPKLAYTPYNPSHGRSSITFPVIPNILKNLKPKVYHLNNELGGDMTITLELNMSSAPDNLLRFPLQLEDYCKLKDEKVYTYDSCVRCDKRNARVFEHNEYMVKLLTQVVKLNGCQTSAGTITQPGKPTTSAMDIFKKTAEEFMKDNHERLKFSIKYLYEKMFISAVKDYHLEDAIFLADCISFYRRAVKRIMRPSSVGPTFTRIDKKENDQENKTPSTSSPQELKVRFCGQPPLYWDGISQKKSLDGTLLWEINHKHCARYPDCRVSTIGANGKTIFEGITDDAKPTAYKNTYFSDARTKDFHSFNAVILHYFESFSKESDKYCLETQTGGEEKESQPSQETFPNYNSYTMPYYEHLYKSPSCAKNKSANKVFEYVYLGLHKNNTVNPIEYWQKEKCDEKDRST